MINHLTNNAKIIKMTFCKTKDNFTQRINAMLNQVLNTAKTDISEEKRYPIIIKKFANNDKRMNYNSLSFTISQDSDKLTGHMLEVVLSHPSKDIGIKRPLAYGTKEHIIKFLEQKDSLKSVEKDILEMNNELLSY